MLSEKLRKYQNHRVKSDALHIFSTPHELLSSSVGRVVRASASGPANVGLIPSPVKPMTLFFVFSSAISTESRAPRLEFVLLVTFGASRNYTTNNECGKI